MRGVLLWEKQGGGCLSNWSAWGRNWACAAQPWGLTPWSVPPGIEWLPWDCRDLVCRISHLEQTQSMVSTISFINNKANAWSTHLLQTRKGESKRYWNDCRSSNNINVQFVCCPLLSSAFQAGGQVCSRSFPSSRVKTSHLCLVFLGPGLWELQEEREETLLWDWEDGKYQQVPRDWGVGAALCQLAGEVTSTQRGQLISIGRKAGPQTQEHSLCQRFLCCKHQGHWTWRDQVAGPENISAMIRQSQRQMTLPRGASQEKSTVAHPWG